MMVNIYVAGSSRESDRVSGVFEMVRAAPQLRLAHDWLQIQAGESTPDDQLTREKAAVYADGDLSHVGIADVFWLLAPKEATRGAWIEFGYALALAAETTRPVLIVASGRCEQSIFCALAAEYEEDIDAFSAIVDWATERALHGTTETAGSEQ